MKKIFLLLLLAFSVTLTTAQAAILRVGTGSWGASFNTIQEAVTAAAPNDEIWIKQGTYPFSKYLTVDKAVSLYGGFNGTETLRTQRNWGQNVTTIDGQNLVTCLYITADATVDGFTITRGNANPALVSNPITDQPCGGGIFNLFRTVVVSNCIFKENHADYCGGGIMNMGGDLTITNCVFFGNTASSGGGIYNAIGNLKIVNSTFSGNTASSNTGAIFNYWTQGYSCNFSLTDSIAWGNNGVSGIYSSTGVTVSVSYSDIQGGFSGTGNINKNPLFVNSSNTDYHLQTTSPCIDAGNNAAVPSGVTTDLDANLRFIDNPAITDTGYGTPPIVDMGAYEFNPAGTSTIPSTTTTTIQTTTTTTAPETVIALSSFTATPKADRVILEWTTESEIDNAGFNLYRAESENGDYAKINTALISAQGSSTQGASYEFTDTTVQNRKTYYYKLEDIDLSGKSTIHGPVNATPRLIYGLGK